MEVLRTQVIIYPLDSVKINSVFEPEVHLPFEFRKMAIGYAIQSVSDELLFYELVAENDKFLVNLYHRISYNQKRFDEIIFTTNKITTKIIDIYFELVEDYIYNIMDVKDKIADEKIIPMDTIGYKVIKHLPT